jgi:hypothetical protein
MKTFKNFSEISDLEKIKRTNRMRETVNDHKFFISFLLDVYKQSPPTDCSIDTIKTFQRRAELYLDLDHVLI